MAAIPGDSVLFPPLDKCLSGEQQLLSWKEAFAALSGSDHGRQSPSLQSFLTDGSNAAVLSKPFQPFQPPNAQSKSSFETKTAAINVTPSDNGQYNIDEIKEDTTWLSGETNTDEVAALRIVLLEWQMRPAAQLLSGFTEEETLSVQDAAGGANLGSSTFIPKSSILAATASGMGQNFIAFSSKEQRRLRLLETYLSERIHILRASDLLVRIGTASEASSETQGKSQTSWFVELGKNVVSAQQSGVFKNGIEALRSRFQGLADGSGWYQSEWGNADAEEMWGHAQLAEATYILQLIFTHADLSSELLPSDVVLMWFETMESYDFFRSVQMPFQSQQTLVPHLQLLIAIVTLALLNLRGVIKFIETEGAAPAPVGGSDGATYVQNSHCVQKLTELFLAIGAFGPTPASPALFAWTIFGLILRNEGASISQERDHQIAQGSPGVETTTVEKLYEVISAVNTEEDEEPVVILTNASIIASRIYELVAELALNLTTMFDGRQSCSDGNEAIDIDSNYRLEARMRLQLLSLIREGLFTVEYSPEVILSVLSVLNGGRTYWDLADQPTTKSQDPLLDAFLSEEGMGVLNEAKLRYPYETLPLLQFCKALCFGAQTDDEGELLVAKWLQEKGQFTQVLPPKFTSYMPVREEENSYAVQLTEDMSLFWNRKTAKRPVPEQPNGDELVLADDMQADEVHVIPAGTVGYVLNPDVKPLVIAWVHKHSAVRYLATYLSSFLVGNETIDTATGKAIGIETASEFIGLLAMLVTASAKAATARGADPRKEAQLILEDASDGLGRNQDIVSLVFDTFEQELQRLRERPNTEGTLELLVNCLYFIHALVGVFPNRVWPFLTRSKLLDLEGTGGSMVAIVSGTEMVIGRYGFLMGCARLFQALTTDSIEHSVSNKVSTKSVVRFASSPAVGGGSPEKIMSKVLLSFAKTFAGVFESCPGWRFAVPEQKLELNWQITSVFHHILRTVYGYDDEAVSPADKLVGVLAPAAEYLMDAFSSPDANDISTHAILNIFYTGTTPPPITTSTRITQLWTVQTISAISFATLVLRAGALLDRPTSYLEKQLFKASPLLARLSIAHEAFKSPSMALFEALVKSAARGEKEPPSLLGHLGPETARAFLSNLSNMSGPLKDTQVEVDIWRLLSVVVSSKQQWLSIYLLTGSTPRDSMKKTGQQVSGRPRGKPLLMSALDQLCSIDSLEPRRAVAMLEFISLAQNHWPWAVTSMHKHRNFLHRIMDFVLSLQPPPAGAPPDTVSVGCIKIQMASLVSDIGAMCLHYARQLGDLRPAQHVIAKLGFLLKHGVEPPTYNQSLHTNMKRNVETKFPSVKLSHFKKTGLQRTEFGKNYFYDLEFASEVLGFDQAWSGKKNGKGFADEFARANVNLSLVEAQVMLLKSWKLLAIELGCLADKDHRLEEILTQVVGDCLKANRHSNGSQALFDRLVHVRADFAFVLMQRLVSAECKGDDMRALFGVSWETIRMSGQDFDIAFMGENAAYYRTLLRILFLTLQPHIAVDGGDQAPKEGNGIQKSLPKIASELMEILERVVAKGLRSLAHQLHEDRESCAPSDFVLLSALLQHILRVPGMHVCHAEVALLFANNGTSRYATSLFTWADRLAIDGDPIYGELSILFLLELSSILPMAETLAVEGVFSRLSTANLINYYRKPRGMGPFDQPARLFSIWARGILPLCLNLLDAVGAPVAAEITAFLNQFPEQLGRASAALNPRSNAPSAAAAKDPNAGNITLGTACEAHSLALIGLVLDRFRTEGAAGAAAAEMAPLLNWDRAGVKEDVEGWLQGRRSLRERIVPVNERELELAKAAAGAQSGAENRLEERVVAELVGALECLNAAGGGGGSGTASTGSA